MSELRAMCLGDVSKVITLIHAHDDDDAEAAEADFEHDGFENHFVLERDDRVIGVTGFRQVDGTDNTYWLSWTYLAEAFQGQGLGKKMTLELIDTLKAQGGRKLFAKVSNYEDPEDGKIYEAAQKMYASVGFELAVTSQDFYDEGEDQLILALDLQPPADNSDEPAAVTEEKPNIRFVGMHEIAETDGAYTFAWDVDEKKRLFGKKNFTVIDLQIGLKAVKADGGRKVFLTFPSNLPLIHKPLQATGFSYVGQLADYYEQGVHELHFSHDLSHLQEN